MNTLIIIYIIISSLFLAFLVLPNYKLNKYIGNLEKEIDDILIDGENTKRVLEEAIKEDYLEKGKTLKVKKPRVSKSEME